MPGLSSHARKAAVAIVIAAAALLIELAGGFRPFDNALHDLRVRTVDIPASGDFVLVEIDATSLRRLGAWPWPRGHHATVLDRLVEAGAASVGFDISFSSPSVETQDQRLAEAAARAGGRLVLPVFRQLHHSVDGTTGVLLDRPFPALERAASLASINVQPDSDGIVRSLLAVDVFGEVAVPSMSAALLAPHRQGSLPEGRFVLDYGIDVASIPRLSYADVLIGSFDPAAVAGKSVLIGATAVELGDVMAVPRWGNLPGPFVIAIGFESMHLDRAVTPVGSAWLVFLLCLAAAVAPSMARGAGVAWAIVPAVIQITGLVALAEALYVFGAIKWDLSAVAAALVVAYGLEFARVVRAQTRRIAVANREARRRIALLRSVVDTSIDAVVIADHAGTIHIANPACLPVFGHEPDALVGTAVEGLIDPADPLAVPLRAMTGSGAGVPALSYPVDVAGTHRDGRTLELDLALSEVGANSGDAVLDERYTIWVFRDVSERRRMEAMRRDALEAQVEAERSKADFLGTASHELRTPLNHIKGFANLLTAGVGGTLTDKQREYLGDIETAADHLTGIVTDILATAQATAGDAGSHRPVTPADLIRGACEEVAAIASEGEVEIAIDLRIEDATVLADQSLTRALMHILRNAVQFSPPHGAVELSCALLEPGRLHLEVRDRGAGMTAEELDRISRPFGQLEGALSRQHGGLGIGLSVARTAIEGHGGTLTLLSEKGKGTTARIELPLAPPAAERAAA